MWQLVNTSGCSMRSKPIPIPEKGPHDRDDSFCFIGPSRMPDLFRDGGFINAGRLCRGLEATSVHMFACGTAAPAEGHYTALLDRLADQPQTSCDAHRSKIVGNDASSFRKFHLTTAHERVPRERGLQHLRFLVQERRGAGRRKTPRTVAGRLPL